jgi:hypothetical protein
MPSIEQRKPLVAKRRGRRAKKKHKLNIHSPWLLAFRRGNRKAMHVARQFGLRNRPTPAESLIN